MSIKGLKVEGKMKNNNKSPDNAGLLLLLSLIVISSWERANLLFFHANQ
jgi:hypothetical protein